MQVSGLYIYPIKSCAGCAVDALHFDACGPRGDRRWMLVDADGEMFTQRSVPQLARLVPQLTDTGLLLSIDGAELPVEEPARATATRTVHCWGDACPARDAGDAVAAFLSAALAQPCRLVMLDPDHRRPVGRHAAGLNGATSFTDGFPLLLISEASLDDLNQRMLRTDPQASPIGMERFRPNIVVSGCEAFAEDAWHELAIGSQRLAVVKPCSRCSITTVDQTTGSKAGKEPLRTLAGYRRIRPDGPDAGKVYFGQNCMPLCDEALHLGDTVRVIAPV